MKICHIITRLILGGAQENTVLTCEGLHAMGHQVTLVTGPPLGPEGELLSRARRGGYEVVILDDLRRAIDPRRDLRAYRQIRSLLHSQRPDIMHSHSSKAGILARQAAWSVGVMKIVHTIHGLPFHPYQGWLINRLYVHLERHAARQSHAIISVADAMTRQALAAGVGQSQQYSTIYSGMEVEPYLEHPPAADEFLRQLNLPPGSVLVTQVSRLAELKGHEFILAAAQKVANPQVHFCFVGDGHLRQQIQQQIKQMGLQQRIHLTGLLPPTQIPAIMHASDLVVHCSLREGLARAIPQAMLAGRPVISFDVDGAAEVVNDQTGILLPPRDVPGLTRAIDTLAADADLRRRLGQAGRQLCLDRFDYRKMVQRIDALYQRL